MENQVEVLSFLEDDRFVFNGANTFEVEKYVNGVEPKCVCFTGSRPNSLPWKSNEKCELCVSFKQKLRALIIKLYDMGYRRFISGMALGVDTLASEVILDLKEEGYKLFLECAIACKNQEFKWAENQKRRYHQILNRADKVTYVSSDYSLSCYSTRNSYMVDHSSVVIACHFSESSGTASTIAYAKKLSKKIIFISY